MTNDEKKSDRGHADRGQLPERRLRAQQHEQLPYPDRRRSDTQTDIEIPEDNPWDEVPDSNTGTGH